jgi:uncharacterized protein (DUF362 family)
VSITVVKFTDWRESIAAALDDIGAGEVLARQEKILIKPNLVNDSPHPVTTAPACCEALVLYIRACSDAEVLIAEGCGDAVLETSEVFANLGYAALSRRHNVSLMDLNTAPLRRLANPACRLFPEIYLPEIAFTHFIISVPVLKAHSLSDMTGALKNMIGFAPPKHYSGRFGSWKKAVFHQDVHNAITELNLYRAPDLAVMDASVGLAGFHLGGPPCDPPVGRIIAGFDPLEVDRAAAGFLNLDWRVIRHLQ